MVNETVYTYLKTYKDKFSIEDLKKEIISKGYTESDFDEALQKLHEETENQSTTASATMVQKSQGNVQEKNVSSSSQTNNSVIEQSNNTPMTQNKQITPVKKLPSFYSVDEKRKSKKKIFIVIIIFILLFDIGLFILLNYLGFDFFGFNLFGSS